MAVGLQADEPDPGAERVADAAAASKLAVMTMGAAGSCERLDDRPLRHDSSLTRPYPFPLYCSSLTQRSLSLSFVLPLPGSPRLSLFGSHALFSSFKNMRGLDSETAADDGGSFGF